MLVRKSEIVTGLFVLAGIVILAFVSWGWVTGQGKKTEFVAHFDEVGLLKPKAKVMMNGIKVGSVEAIDATEDWKRVEVVFSVLDRYGSRLKAGTQVEVGRESLLGEMYLKIKPELEGGELPERENRLFIDDGKAPLDMFATFEKLSRKLDPVVEKVSTLLDKLNNDLLSQHNTDKLTSILDNTDELIVTTKQTIEQVRDRVIGDGETMDKLDALMANLSKTLDDARANLDVLTEKGVETLDSAKVLMDNANEKVTAVADSVTEEVVPNATELMKSTQGSITRLERKMVDSLENADVLMADIDRLATNKDLLGTLYEARRLMQELQLLSISLRADPSQLLWGGPGVAEEAADRKRNESELRASGRAKRYGY